MIAVPKTATPNAGYPIVIAKHGYVPELFASRGFLVVMPDYRGHNNSEGLAYINPQDEKSTAYYAEDVVALMTALDQVELGDSRDVYMWSHSLGGTVSLRALLATNIVKASSFWSTMNITSTSKGGEPLLIGTRSCFGRS
jgi:pimeloyl-ACP methyl ester carboxylesterase